MILRKGGGGERERGREEEKTNTWDSQTYVPVTHTKGERTHVRQTD